MVYIVKMTVYKHRTSINLPAVLVRKMNLKKYTHVTIRRAKGGELMIKGYKDEKEFE